MAAAEAAGAKRKKILTPKPSVATVADPSLPAGVGIMGRGRAAVNAPLTSDGSTVQALQQRRTSMPGCQTLSIGAVASWCTTLNHMVGAERKKKNRARRSTRALMRDVAPMWAAGALTRTGHGYHNTGCGK